MLRPLDVLLVQAGEIVVPAVACAAEVVHLVEGIGDIVCRRSHRKRKRVPVGIACGKRNSAARFGRLYILIGYRT